MTTNEAALKLARVVAEQIVPDGLNQNLSLRVTLRAIAEQGALTAILEVTERAAGLAYATCAETRHVTLGDKVATALRNMEHLS